MPTENNTVHYGQVSLYKMKSSRGRRTYFQHQHRVGSTGARLLAWPYASSDNLAPACFGGFSHRLRSHRESLQSGIPDEEFSKPKWSKREEEREMFRMFSFPPPFKPYKQNILSTSKIKSIRFHTQRLGLAWQNNFKSCTC